MTATVVEPIEHLDDQWDISCEAGLVCDKQRPAEWIVHFDCCCPKAVTRSLWCTGCKDRLLTAKNALCSLCGKRWTPAVAAFTHIEPLNRRPQ